MNTSKIKTFLHDSINKIVTKKTIITDYKITVNFFDECLKKTKINPGKIGVFMRDRIDTITGKTAIIEDYNIILNFLTYLSHSEKIPTEIREDISANISNITKSEPIYSGHTTITYDPHNNSRKETLDKISKLCAIQRRVNAVYDLNTYWRSFLTEYSKR